MNPIKAIIVDDEPNARKALRGMLNEQFEEVLVLADCGNVPEAVKMINRFKPDLIFLDIDMPGYSGFELLDFFDEQQIWFKIIFVTAYSEYSLKAFESSAVDYILKPVRLEHMKRALRKVNINSPSPIQYKVLRDNFNLQNERKVVLQTSETIYVVNQDDIIFIQAEGSYTKIVTVSHGILTITKKLAEFEYLETDASFFRAHRSYLVNLNHIKRIDKRDFLLVMSNEAQVQLAQDKKALLIERFTA
ncbi:LytR/AlgR family response regulator transcription factor [Sediminibacterium sp. TEGAF015]|uniref:LytR/AlgR family response regulator transcription factor n=1 Tax=Sediminibacterium sp. TEGAF015 TaxID=575378 RepID=UPI00220D6DEA|nr:response regulator [Sediminibacterium sp. TEGAF015]BDQ12961.1 DNA-binding response regulator [Sediminibacterium sp. TEGAF015]